MRRSFARNGADRFVAATARLPFRATIKKLANRNSNHQVVASFCAHLFLSRLAFHKALDRLVGGTLE